MDLVVFIIGCVFLLIFALLGMWKYGMFALVGGLAGLLIGISVTVDGTIEVAYTYSGGWLSHTVTAYPIAWIMVLLTLTNWLVLFMKLRLH